MDMGFDEGCATLVALVDGSASLYLSSGGGTIGGGDHKRVADAARRLISLTEEHLELIPRSTEDRLPANGSVVIHALTYDGRHAVEVVEDELGNNQHELSAVFFGAHDVITEIRLIGDDSTTRASPE